MQSTSIETSTHHYGILVDKNTPIPGVIQNYSATWVMEELERNGEDTAYKAVVESFKKDGIEEKDIDWDSIDLESEYCYGYLPDGEFDLTKDFTAVQVNSPFYCIQVVHSAYVTRSNLCSPCCPGQADLDTPGDYLAYSLPLELYDADSDNIPEIFVWDLEHERKKISDHYSKLFNNWKHALNNPCTSDETLDKLIDKMTFAIEYISDIGQAIRNNEKLTIRQRRLEL